MNRKVFWLAMMTLALALPASADGPFRFYALTPCRLYDTRQPADAPALTHLATRNFTVQGKCNVPPGAKAVALNVTILTPTGQGYLTLFPSNALQRPKVSTINYAGGEAALANGAIVPLAPSTPDLSVFSYIAEPFGASGTGHVILDVTGYFAVPTP